MLVLEIRHAQEPVPSDGLPQLRQDSDCGRDLYLLELSEAFLCHAMHPDEQLPALREIHQEQLLLGPEGLAQVTAPCDSHRQV